MSLKLSPIKSSIMWPVKKFGEIKKIKGFGVKVFDNNRKAIDGLGVTSIILKDGLGCVLYVKQSLANKEIPDDKRRFVASLDLTNGALMIAMQILMFYTVSHKACQSKMFNKFFGKMFDRPLKKTYQAIVKNTPGYENIGNIEFTQGFEKLRQRAKDAFGGVTSLVAASIVGKRVIVPFIATPLAGIVERKMAERDDKKNTPAKEVNQDKFEKINLSEKMAKDNETTFGKQTNQTSNTNLLNKYKK